MKRYSSFTEMAKDTKSVEPEVLNRLETIGGQLQATDCQHIDNQCSAFVNNYYGWGIPVSSDMVGEVGISVEANDFPSNSREFATWEKMKSASNPTIMTVDILGKAPDHSKFDAIRCSLDLGSGKLFLNGLLKGTLPISPADAFMAVVDENNCIPKSVSLPEMVEEHVWKFVKANIDKFDWNKNEQ